MAALIKGITVTLYERTQIGTDDFHAPVYQETPVQISNVLVSPVASAEIVNGLQLYGKRSEYELSIPKGDSHRWESCRVDFFGTSWQTLGFSQLLIEELVPLEWNRKIKVERYG